MEIEDIISDAWWLQTFKYIFPLHTDLHRPYQDDIGRNFCFDPLRGHIMTTTSTLFDIKKAAAMYFWYKKGDRADTSILEYFDEYEHCIDDKHPIFNSNYGYYAYTQGGLKKCIERLKKDRHTRQACFCINNNEAMSDGSIDKLCTNAIQFYIKDNALVMIIQMRSSNFITLLPYDVFMFSVFYAQVLSELKKTYNDVYANLAFIQAGSVHYYRDDMMAIKPSYEKLQNILIDISVDNWQQKLEEYLQHKLNKNEDLQSKRR